MLMLLVALNLCGQVPAEPVTYCGRVAAILQRNCQRCHRPGTAAPFALLTYDDAVKWADSVREAVVDRRMPPWFADPRHGKFANDARLKAADVAALTAWVDAGRPLGDRRQLPPNPTYRDGWTIGQPDLVLELPEPEAIPAAGQMPYRYAITPTRLPADTWVQAAEVLPGDHSVVHHVNVSFQKHGGRRADEVNTGVGGTGLLLGGVPGDWGWTLPPGEARKVPKGCDLVWEIHYVPNGKPTTDRSRIGLVFYKGTEPPRCSIHTFALMNRGIAIAPHAADYVAETEWLVPEAMEVLAFNPHLHLRGKSFEYTLLNPDGTATTLLSIPRYDFNWQLTYKLERPLRVPAGARVHCTAHFDNSAGNPTNPDPTQAVTWGSASTDEMMIGFLDVRFDAGTTALPRADRGDLHQRVYLDARYPPTAAAGSPPAADGPPPLADGPRSVAQRLGAFFRTHEGENYWFVSLAGLPVLVGALLWRRNARRARAARPGGRG